MGGRWTAAAVHLFTACGVVCGLLALIAVRDNAFERMFLWLGLALVIDGVDGYFARRADVKRVLPRFSGEQLDLVIDYITYVFVPVAALLQAGFLVGWAGLVLAAAILLSSLFHFSDTESKTADHHFVGFPAIWNIVAFYIFALGLAPGLAAALIVVCVVATFVPLQWVHPLRVRAWRQVTAGASVAWGAAALLALGRGLPAAGLEQAVLIAVAVYGIGLSLYRGQRS